MPGRPDYLALRELTKTFAHRHGTHHAVDGVSLEVAEGEFVSLLGPSGSGKTTTLMMIAGFVAPSAGAIVVDDRSIADVPPHRRNIGVVFQSYALFPKMTVAANVGFPLRMRGVSRARVKEQVTRLLTLVGLEAYADRRPAQLSGGQQQRVALARALVFDPGLLLLDEPMSALDRKLREQLQLEVRRIQRTLNVTTLYVTHDQDEAMLLSDRVAIMDGGRVQQLGTPREVYTAPANRFVAQFLGETNVVPATVVAGDAGSPRATVAGGLVGFAARRATRAGERVELFVRPEQVTLAAAGERALAGRVAQALYLGDTTRYRVRLGDGTLVTAAVANRSDAPRFAAEQQVSLDWEAASARVLD
ncbi:MAG: ABC transporter ATP-binding protein [Actinobacteria bacterium]|nr:ABC transporter ATP-binding protein [Actinomycetota bacterium]